MTMRSLAFLLIAGFVLVMMAGEVDAEDEYEFRFDDPVDGEGNVDPEATIYLKVEIENYLDIMHEFELRITNSEELENSGIETWWSNDGQNNVSSSKATHLPSVDVPDSSVRDGITITVSATSNALYGNYAIELKCRDKDNSDPEGTKQLLTLTVSVSQRAEVSLEIAESGSTEGSIEVDSETTYLIKVNNDGNREDTISLATSSNEWDCSLADSITVAPFSNEIVTLTVQADMWVNYGDSDEVNIAATSGNSGDAQGTLDVTTFVRVLYGLDLTATTVSKSGEPGNLLIFNFQVMNKWSESVDFEITKKDWYRGTIDNKPDSGWSHTDGTGTLDAFEEITTSSSNSLKITISSSADAGEVITIIVVAKVSTDNDLIGAIETEIQVRVEGNYEVQLILPQSDQIYLDAGRSISTSKYIKVKNFAKASDLITITTDWEIGGNDWTKTHDSTIIICASCEEEIEIFVKAPTEAGDGNQAILKIRVTSGGDDTQYDEASITFKVNNIFEISNPKAIAGKNVTVNEGEVIRFLGRGTIENGTIVLYEWDFDGDGLYEWSSEDNGITTFIYDDVGKYVATLRVTDNLGVTATDNKTILVIAKEDDSNISVPSVSLISSIAAIGIIALRRRY